MNENKFIFFTTLVLEEFIKREDIAQQNKKTVRGFPCHPRKIMLVCFNKSIINRYVWGDAVD